MFRPPQGIPKGSEPVRFSSETTSNGVSERLFTLDDLPGVLWSPAAATGSRPLVLLGHGGGQHKQVPGLVARAPAFELESSARFFTRHLLDGGASVTAG
jgi:hypothetical protein